MQKNKMLLWGKEEVLPMVITLELEGGERIQLVQQGVGVDHEIFAEFEKQTDDLAKDLEESSTYFTRFRLRRRSSCAIPYFLLSIRGTI